MRYLFEGSLRRLGERAAVRAQLISTETGAHVRAERLEGERGKLGELQVDVVASLANSLGVKLVKAKALPSMRERPNNSDVIDLAIIYTTNAIEALNAKLRRAVRTRGHFPDR